jgi:hypothetical protein
VIFTEVDLELFLFGAPFVIFDAVGFVALIVLWRLFGRAVVLSFLLEFPF